MGRHTSGATITSPPVIWGPVGREFRVTVEQARAIGVWRLRGGRTRFRRVLSIIDYVPKAGHPPPPGGNSGRGRTRRPASSSTEARNTGVA
jgi:hypothetical protein